MNYLMDRAAEAIRGEIKDLEDALQALYVSGIHESNTARVLLVDRLSKLKDEIKTYEE